MTARKRPATVQAVAYRDTGGHICADAYRRKPITDEYRCLIVPDVPCAHEDPFYGDTDELRRSRIDSGWCEECGAWWSGTKWRKPRILRAGRRK